MLLNCRWKWWLRVIAVCLLFSVSVRILWILSSISFLLWKILHMSVFFSSLLMFLSLLKWKSSSRRSLFYFLCHCRSWISLNSCLSWFDHEFRRLFRRLKLWWFSMIVIREVLKREFDFRNWLCFFWISWRIWSRICAVSLVEHIEFFDAELLRAFMRDLRIFFDCVCVRRWSW